MSRRADQIASVLHRALEEVIARGFNDPRIQGLVSVTRVSVSADFRNATIGVSVFPHEKAQVSLHGLRAAAGHIRRRVGEQVAMRAVPQLAFELDESVRKHAEALEAIARASADLKQREEKSS